MSFYPTPRPATLGTIEDGPAGTAATLKIMVSLARAARRDPGVIQIARQLVRDLNQYDRAGELASLHAFVRDSIRYTNDPVSMEMVQTPRATLEMGTGDCDDKATLLAALLASIGRRSRFVAVGFTGAGYQHVLVEAFQQGRGWVPLETILPVAAGWGPKNVKRRMVMNV